jgi:hypothetical protein
MLRKFTIVFIFTIALTVSLNSEGVDHQLQISEGGLPQPRSEMTKVGLLQHYNGLRGNGFFSHEWKNECYGLPMTGHEPPTDPWCRNKDEKALDAGSGVTGW